MRPIPALIAPAIFITAAPAYAAEYLTVEQAQRALFREADRFVDAAVNLTREQRNEIERLSGVRQRSEHQAVWRAESGGRALGWFIVDDVVGKHEFITYAVALTLDGKVAGIDIMVYRETYGGEIRSAEWRRQFVGKSIADPLAIDRDITNLTGATLSCRNVTNGVRRLLALQRIALPHA